MEVLLCRQPVLDRRQKTCAYELLYRSCPSAGFDGNDADAATMQVLATSLMSNGAELLSGKAAFVNFTRDLLLKELAFLFPPDLLVVEILESVPADGDVIAACRKLRAKGYRIALDDFAVNEHTRRLVDFASIVKADFRTSSAAERERILYECARPGLQLLAEKVETEAEFRWALRHGFDYFQGYFFARPVVVPHTEIPSFKVNLLRVFAALHAPLLDYAQIERVVKQEPQLCYRLLGYVNSAAFGLRARVASVRAALTLLGEDELRKWLTLAALPALASDRPDILAETAVLRGRLCELLAFRAGLRDRSGEFFVMGMFSLLDALVGRPLGELLGQFHLCDDVREALLGASTDASPAARIYHLALAAERGEWHAVEALTAGLQISPQDVSEAYFEAALWCRRVYGAPQGGEQRASPREGSPHSSTTNTGKWSEG